MKSVDSATTPQQRAIRAVVATIPSGRVCSYGEIAARAGLPGRARMVGKALGAVPGEAELPWHRVLRADGRIAFPRGSRAYLRQRRRLLDEGVLVVHGRVDLERHGWERDLDSLLWGPPPSDDPPPRRRARAR
jgi:methylated-DNA-protein-cysteine methyltransferase-like protein